MIDNEITAHGYSSIDFGDIHRGKTTEVTPGLDYDVESYGRMFGTHLGSDEGRFVYTKMSGDFDISVQIADIANTDRNYSEGGLMIRKDLTPTGLYVSMSATGNDYDGECDQYMFMYRMQRFGSLEPSDQRQISHHWGPNTYGNDSFGYAALFPYYLRNCSARLRPYPNVTVRITKKGLRYTGYSREYDLEWVKFSDICVDLGKEFYVGMFVNANEHSMSYPVSPDAMATVKFRNLQGIIMGK